MREHAVAARREAALIEAVEDLGVDVEASDSSIDGEGTPIVEVAGRVSGDPQSQWPDTDALESQIECLRNEVARLRLERDELARRCARRPSRYESRSNKDVVLAVLEDHGQCTAAEIEDHLDSDISLQKQLQRLRDEGCVEGRQDPEDARRWVYELASGQGRSETSDEGDDADIGGLTAALPSGAKTEIVEILHAEGPTIFDDLLDQVDIAKGTLRNYIHDLRKQGVVEATAAEEDGVRNAYFVPENAVEIGGASEEDAPSGAADEVDREAIREELAALPDFTDWGAETKTEDTCQNCGAKLPSGYGDVMEPDGVDQVRCCPNCPDLIRDPDGNIREKKHMTGEEKRQAALTDGGEQP